MSQLHHHKIFYVHSSMQANEENEDCFGVIVATRRLASFYKIVDLSSYKLSVELKELLEAGVGGDCCDSILENVITCLRLEIMWGVHALQDTTTPNRVSVLGEEMLNVLIFKFCPLFTFCKGHHTCVIAISSRL